MWWKLTRIVALFRKELWMAWAVLRDARAPWQARLVTLLALLYVVMPLDAVSDLLPVLGWLDDGLVAWLLLKLAARLLPPGLRDALQARARVG